MAQLCQHQAAFERLGVEVLIISFGTLPAAQKWLQETCAPFKLLLDPERTVYQAYGLERSLWRSWNLRTIWRYVQLLSTGREWRGIQGDSAQLGGDFVVDADGIVRLAYRSHDPTDRPSVEQLLAIFEPSSEEQNLNDEYDLIVIGGGSAGLTAAAFGIQLGLRVALVEKHRIGGDCTWTGCVPSKTLIKAARVAHQMRTADRFGLTPVQPEVDLKAVMEHVGSVVTDVYQEESPEALRADGIDVYLGSARFIDPHSLAVGDTVLSGRRFLIATGAHPFIPPIPGLDEVDYLTYENIWDLEELPRHLLVVGAGPIGCEMSQAFRRLGAEVTLLDAESRLLPRDDAEASRVLATVFEAEGIALRLGTPVDRVWQDRDAKVYLLAGGQKVVGDALLLAVGRRPNVAGVGLANAGVAYGAAGIQVDDYLRTSQRHIYAAGDCTGGPQFTHYAGWQAAMAVRNAFLPGASKGVTDRVPWTTFTDPEVAHIGLTEEQARQQLGDDLKLCEWPMEQVDRARAEVEDAGFIKLVLEEDNSLLGATIVAGRAGEMIQEWVMAMEHGLKADWLSSTMHVYPTYSMSSMQAAYDIRLEKLMDGTSGQVVRALLRLMR